MHIDIIVITDKNQYIFYIYATGEAIMKEQVIDHITSRLEQLLPLASDEYKKNKEKYGIGFCIIDNLLPVNVANQIYQNFDPLNSSWREINSFRESKLTTKQYDQFDLILKETTFAFQDSRVIKCVEKITGLSHQLPDSQLYAGGLSMMRKNDFLDPHIDNSHDQEQKKYRRLNLLYYVTPDWKIENGGNLELWDIDVRNAVTIVSQFNRLVLMETHKTSWHSVSKVLNDTLPRCCVSNYYFSEQSPTGDSYYNVTSFMARPQQPIKRIFCVIDNTLRATLRILKKRGFGKKDIYVQKV